MSRHQTLPANDFQEERAIPAPDGAGWYQIWLSNASMKLEVPAHKTLLHTVVTPIRWGDMDAFGHVNNTIYFRYMETARIDMMRKAGFLGQPSTAGFVIANAFCNFIRQFEYPGDVLIKTYVGTIGKSSFDSYH